jgi:hypothetical protein
MQLAIESTEVRHILLNFRLPGTGKRKRWLNLFVDKTPGTVADTETVHPGIRTAPRAITALDELPPAQDVSFVNMEWNLPQAPRQAIRHR